MSIDNTNSTNNNTISSTKEYQEEIIKKHLIEAKRNAYDATNYGKETIVSLTKQEEDLDSIQDILESNDEILKKSMISLQNMTWSGYIHNSIVNTTEYINKNLLSNIHNNNNNNGNNNNNSINHISSNSNIHTNEKIYNESHNFVNDQEDLNELSSIVINLHQMSIDIGQHLDNQKIVLDDINNKTEDITDKTLAVTIKASQLSNKTNKYKPIFIGTYQFVDIETGYYLSISNNLLTLTNNNIRNQSTYFNCYQKENNLYGLQNAKYLKYLGTSIWGTIVANADHFGTFEECYLDLNSSTTGILFIARNWNHGGWLKRTNVCNNNTSTANKYTNNSNDYSNNNIISYNLVETTSSITDRVDMIRFAAIIMSLNK